MSLRPITTTLQGGVVVNHDRMFEADVLIKDELIEAVGPGLKVRASTPLCAAARRRRCMPPAALLRARWSLHIL